MRNKPIYDGRPRYTGILAGVIGSIIVFLLSIYQIFKPLDHLLYDGYIQYGFQHKNSPKDIMIIEIDRPIDLSHDWLAFLNRIQEHKPKQIMFTSWPQHATKPFYQAAAAYGNVLFGRNVWIDAADHHTWRLEPLPPTLSDPPPPYGLVAMPPAYRGVHRTQHAFFNFKGKRRPALEVLALQRQAGRGVLSLSRPYPLNFKGGAKRLPKVSLHRMLTNGMAPELIEGRHILIGPNLPGVTPRLHTPLHPHEASLSLLEYHGLALDTLLSGQITLSLSKTTIFSLIMSLLAINLFLYQYTSMRLASWLTPSLIVLYIALGWLLFTHASRWLPVPELILSQLGAFFLVFREKAVTRERLLGKILLHIAAQTQERMAAPSFLTSHEHWSQVVGMLSQMLDLSRLILLERINSDHRVKEIIAWQCSFEDIYERRRDFHRPPYSTAINERRLLRIDDRPFLKTIPMAETQFLMPLIFSGEVYGFWVFGIESYKIHHIPQFESVIEEFGSQIATLLYRRQQWMSHAQSAYRQRLQTYLQLEGGEQTYLHLTQSFTLMTHRLGRFENIWAHLSTATIAYNLFGNVVHVNKRMVDLLQTSQLNPYHMNLLDVMVTLCNLDESEARELLRRIAFEKTHLSLPTTLPNNSKRYYILHLQPIIQNDVENVHYPEDIQPFHITGILCELVDITDIKQTQDFKIQIVEKIHNEIQEDLKSFTHTFAQVESDPQTPHTTRAILIPMKQAVDHLILILDNMYKILNVDNNNQKKGVYPVNLQEIISSAIDDYVLPTDKDIQINMRFSGENKLVFATPSQLKYAIHTMFDLLANDAIDNSHITIDVRDDAESVLCVLSNTGFGMPNARLQDYLFGSADIDSEAFMKFRQSMTEVRRWAATLEATSDMGVGLRFALKLKAFFKRGPASG